MSGSYKKRDGFVYLFNEKDGNDPFYRTMFEAMFDEQTDMDVLELQEEMEAEKEFRKVCWLKTVIFPVEVVAAYFIMGKSWAKDKIKAQKFYWKFLRKQITLDDLKVEVAKLLKE